MEVIPNPDRSPREPPSDHDPGGDVREPPLAGNDGTKEDFPGDTDLINPDEGGGRIKKSARRRPIAG